MLSQRLHDRIRRSIANLQRFADRPWYPVLVGILAALDNVLIIIPTDGILISSAILTPKRWLRLALGSALGSTIGALILALAVREHGLALVLPLYPSIEETTAWVLTLRFLSEYGLLLVFLVALTPLAQQPAVILTALASTPMIHLALAILAGRTIKYILLGYAASHAPKLLKKMWGLKGEIKDAGVPLDRLES